MNDTSLQELSDPAGVRTQDPMIKSHVLYQLSYGIMCYFRTQYYLKSSKKE